MSVTKEATDTLCRPIVGIERRTADEVHDIMLDRIRLFLSTLPIAGEGKTEEPNRARVAHAICVALDFPAPQKVKNLLAVREVLDRYYAVSSPGKDGGQEVEAVNPMRFFSENVDRWGGAEWFDRLAKAIREQDKACVAKDDIGFETYRMIAASSAMTLVRDHEATVRAALSPQITVDADAVIERLEEARAEQWRLRRDAEGSRDAARAAADSFKIERDRLSSALSDVLDGWDFWDVNPHDREPPRDAISRAHAALKAKSPSSNAASEGAYHIVFDGFPSPDGPRFIEVENSAGQSIKAGEWRKRDDGLCELVIKAGVQPNG